MKKTTIFLLTSLILIGCNNNENNSQSASLNETKNNYEITFNVTDFNGKALDNYTVKINNNDIKAKENKATIEQLQGSDKIEIESNGYLTNFYDGEELLKQNKKEIVFDVNMAQKASTMGFASFNKAWDNFGDFILSSSRSKDGIRAILSSTNVNWLNDNDSQIELYISTGMKTNYRFEGSYKISYTSNKEIKMLNYKDNSNMDVSLLKVNDYVKKQQLYIDFLIPYSLINIKSDEVIGLNFGEWSNKANDWCSMVSVIDSQEKNVEYPTQYVRIDKNNEVFANIYNCHEEDNPKILYDKDELIKDYPIEFAKTGVSSNMADDIFVKTTIKEDRFVFDMVGFGDFTDEEKIKIVIHRDGENGANWTIQNDDLSIILNKNESSCLTNSTYFFDYENIEDSSKKLTNNPIYKYDEKGYFTVLVEVLFIEIPSFKQNGKYTALFTEFGKEIYNDKCEESMYYNNIPCGDIAFQSSYALIKDKAIIEHQDFENYPIVFATSKDPIYTKIERDYKNECLILSFAGYFELSSNTFIRFILKENTSLTKKIWALEKSDMSFTIFKDAAYYQTGVDDFWTNENGKEIPFIQHSKEDSKTIYTPTYEYSEEKGYFTLEFKIDFTETGIDINENTTLRGILIEFAPSIIGGNCYMQDNKQIGTGDPALQDNYLTF